MFQTWSNLCAYFSVHGHQPSSLMQKKLKLHRMPNHWEGKVQTGYGAHLASYSMRIGVPSWE